MRTLATIKHRPSSPAVQVRESARTGVQAKLAIGMPGDRFEREADRVADAVMRGGPVSVGAVAPASAQRACASCTQEDEKVRAEPLGSTLHASAELSGAIGQARRDGVPLGQGARAFFEPRFGRDLGAVRVHTDPDAQALAGALHARAFTVGSDIFFNRGEYTPGNERGRRLIAHELAHVVQQAQVSAPMVMREPEKCPSGSCHDIVYRDKPFDWERYKGHDIDWIQHYFQLQNQTVKRLNFFHGTRWSVAKKIPGNVKAIGGGDFAAGFYTHHDANDGKARYRALQWACRVARDAKEKYGGVIKFNVDGTKFAALTGRKFNLTSLDQADYTQRQKEWINFITSYGRKPDPVFQQRRSGGVWLHERRDPPQALNYDVVTGPFYKPLPGQADRKPAPGEFEPFSERRDLPQQVVFANKGVDLLNDTDTKVELKQHQCDPLTGNVVDPPDESAAAAAGTPSGREVPMIE